jgi:hypothetical protein
MALTRAALREQAGPHRSHHPMLFHHDDKFQQMLPGHLLGPSIFRACSFFLISSSTFSFLLPLETKM